MLCHFPHGIRVRVQYDNVDLSANAMEVKKVIQGSERERRVVGKSNKNSVLAVYVW